MSNDLRKIKVAAGISLEVLKKRAKMYAEEKAEEWFGHKMVHHTKEYQQQYGFDSREGDKEFSTHNNEADAFKHTFMQAWFTVHHGEDVAKYFGDKHEKDGAARNQASGEENMDLWNNNQGREIGREIWSTFSFKNGYDYATIPHTKFNDIIAKKVMERMRAGKLITNPNDKRRYVPKSSKGTVTGHAAPISSTSTSTSASSPTSTPTTFAAAVNKSPQKSPSQNFSDMIRQKYRNKLYENNRRINFHTSTSSKSQTSGDGQWITVKGRHISIEK